MIWIAIKKRSKLLSSKIKIPNNQISSTVNSKSLNSSISTPSWPSTVLLGKRLFPSITQRLTNLSLFQHSLITEDNYHRMFWNLVLSWLGLNGWTHPLMNRHPMTTWTLAHHSSVRSGRKRVGSELLGKLWKLSRNGGISINTEYKSREEEWLCRKLPKWSEFQRRVLTIIIVSWGRVNFTILTTKTAFIKRWESLEATSKTIGLPRSKPKRGKMTSTPNTSEY